MVVIKEYGGFKTNQLVIDQGTLARIIYIQQDEYMKAKYNEDVVIVRLALINEDGFEFAETTSTVSCLKPFKISKKQMLKL